MAGIDVSKAATVYNVAIAAQDTEYSLTLPTETKRVRFQCRDGTDIRYAFVTGKVAGSTAPYMTLKSGHVYDASGLYFNKGVIYFAAAAGSKVVEVEAWA